jgi:hypothetical protein
MRPSPLRLLPFLLHPLTLSESLISLEFPLILIATRKCFLSGREMERVTEIEEDKGVQALLPCLRHHIHHHSGGDHVRLATG